MSRALTPYDTGEVLEPVIWVVPETGYIESKVAHRKAETSDWGKVDFTDDEDATRFTVWFEAGDEGYILNVAQGAVADHAVTVRIWNE